MPWVIWITALFFVVFSSALFLTAIGASQDTSSSSTNLETQPDSAFYQTIQDSLIELSDCMANHKANLSIDRQRLPFVTLAYAQSLDGKIAIRKNSSSNTKGDDDHTVLSSNFAISSPESLVLTHALRSMHDAVLVGCNTFAIDNPRLNNRLWKTAIEQLDAMRPQPRPVVLDTQLRYIASQHDGNNNTRNVDPNRLIVCCSEKAAQSYLSSHANKDTPFTVLPCKVDPSDGKLNLHDVLEQLQRHHGIQSVMVEGGASILTAFLQQQQQQSLVDYVCVTISPKLLGEAGLPSILGHFKNGDDNNKDNYIALGPLKCITLGPDCVVFSKLSGTNDS
jgi:riboflavin-specific deaminase-like protein